MAYFLSSRSLALFCRTTNNMNLKIPIAILFIFFLAKEISALHPLKMSVADVVYKDKKLHFSFRLFADDFGAEISQTCQKKTAFNERTISSEVLECIQRYMNQHFAFYVNGQEIKLLFKGAKVDDADAPNTVVKVEYETSQIGLELLKRIKIKNSILFRFMSPQTNIMNLTLFPDKDPETFRFDNVQGGETREIEF